MSNTPIKELNSTDPVERAIARRVVRILHDPTLNPAQREDQIRKAQRDLAEHHRRRDSQRKLQDQAATTSLPAGFKARIVAAEAGAVQVGALNKRKAFVWLEAGQCPEGVAANEAPFLIEAPKAAPRRKASLEEAIALRRKALGYDRKARTP